MRIPLRSAEEVERNQLLACVSDIIRPAVEFMGGLINVDIIEGCFEIKRRISSYRVWVYDDRVSCSGIPLTGFDHHHRGSWSVYYSDPEFDVKLESFIHALLG